MNFIETANQAIGFAKQVNEIKYDPSNIGGRKFLSFLGVLIILFFVFIYAAYYRLFTGSDCIIYAGIVAGIFTAFIGGNAADKYTEMKKSNGITAPTKIQGA